jgi:DNA-binding transcriptional LysR family regulator
VDWIRPILPEDSSCVKFIDGIDSFEMDMNSAPPLDLHGLHWVRLVARHRGITAASRVAGLSQSALTRQIQGIEGRLGVKLFERTTRRLELTGAGALLLRETEALPAVLEAALRRLREEFLGQPREIRIGFSRSVSLAHLPGLLHGHRRHHPEVKLTVAHLAGSALIEAVAACQLDLGILCPPENLPGNVEVTRRIEDRFTLLAGRDSPLPADLGQPEAWAEWVAAQSWIAPPARTRSRARIDGWWAAQRLAPAVAMEIDSFDMAIHLVALGLGVACVPRRALSGFPRKRRVQRVPLPIPLSRELVAITPRRGSTPEHVRQFVESILF